MKRMLTLFTISECTVLIAAAQGAFQNLDFECAILTPVPVGQFGGFVPIADALPFWTGYIGTNQTTQVLQNSATLTAPSIDIIGPDWTNGIIEGLYTLALQPGVSPPNPPASVSIAQVGLVPTNAKSFRLKGGTCSVSLAGIPIPLIPIGTGPGYTLYGGDVSAFAGQVAELRLTAEPLPGSPSGLEFVDSLEFSNLAIPEPRSISLWAIGALLLTGHALRGSNSRVR